MGQRGGGAAFMPEKFVFPGGAVDAEDARFAGAAPLSPRPPAGSPSGRRAALVARALPLAAVRELWEETGLMLGRPEAGAAAATVPRGWRGFFAAGLVPHTAALAFVFRAVTPPGRPRRFDARFFLAEAAELAGAAHDDFAGAGEELCHLPGSTSPRRGRCRCRSSPRSCSPSSARCSPPRTRRGRCRSSTRRRRARGSGCSTLDRRGEGVEGRL